MIEPKEDASKSPKTNKVRYCLCYLAFMFILFLLFIILASNSCSAGCLSNSAYSWPCTTNNIDYCCRITFSQSFTQPCVQENSCQGLTVLAWIFGVLFVIGVAGMIGMNCECVKGGQPHYQGIGENVEHRQPQWNQPQAAFPHYSRYIYRGPLHPNQRSNYLNQIPQYANQQIPNFNQVPFQVVPNDQTADFYRHNPQMQHGELKIEEQGQTQAYIYNPPVKGM